MRRPSDTSRENDELEAAVKSHDAEYWPTPKVVGSSIDRRDHRISRLLSTRGRLSDHGFALSSMPKSETTRLTAKTLDK